MFSRTLFACLWVSLIATSCSRADKSLPAGGGSSAVGSSAAAEPSEIRVTALLISHAECKVPRNQRTKADANRILFHVERDAHHNFPFDKLARNISDDEASKANGGDLGRVKRADLPAQAQDLFQRPVGAISSAVERDDGIWLYKRTE
jgi:hypothetical protein